MISECFTLLFTSLLFFLVLFKSQYINFIMEKYKLCVKKSILRVWFYYGIMSAWWPNPSTMPTTSPTQHRAKSTHTEISQIMLCPCTNIHNEYRFYMQLYYVFTYNYNELVNNNRRGISRVRGSGRERGRGKGNVQGNKIDQIMLWACTNMT